MPEILVDIQNVSHRYAVTKQVSVPALCNVSFSIYKGEIFGLVGESGSGKSTMARCLMNICRPTAGSIFMKLVLPGGLILVIPDSIEAVRVICRGRGS